MKIEVSKRSYFKVEGGESGVVRFGKGIGKVGLMGILPGVKGAGRREVSKLFMGLGGGFIVVGAMLMAGYCIWFHCKDRCDDVEEAEEKLSIFDYREKQRERCVTRAVNFSCILSMVIGVMMLMLGYAYGGDGR